LFPAALGQTNKAGSLSVAHATDDPIVSVSGTTADAAWASGSGSIVALLKAIATNAISTAPSPVEVQNPSYEAVAASASAQVMGTAGAAGDILSHVVIIPATTSPGAVSIQDGAGSAITIFAGGASSVTTLIPFVVPLAIVATTNWKITTGTNVSAIGVGKFS
jgi:hypothetical protein